MDGFTVLVVVEVELAGPEQVLGRGLVRADGVDQRGPGGRNGRAGSVAAWSDSTRGARRYAG